MSGWRFWIDRGGTFTDVVAVTPDGEVRTRKLLSADPGRYEDAAVHAVRGFVGVPEGDLPPGLVDEIKMGTTVATNALLERAGEPTVLVVTAGLADVLEIGSQNRPRLFDLDIDKPAPLYARVVEADERVGADGAVVRPLDEARLRRDLEAARAEGFRAAAIVFLHAYRSPGHERRAEAVARDCGFEEVSTSSGAAPVMKIVSRGETAVADAYLTPVLRRYVDAVAGALGPHAPLAFMQSNGGLSAPAAFRGRDAVLSGPAGGVVGMVRAAEEAGLTEVIGFDMGGTSTDVCHFAGEMERTFENVVAGVRLRAPMMRIHTVAAGGGSICRYDKDRLQVGPASAGADPGPLCYRRGGPLTVTDCNLMTGRIQADHFPRIFGPSGSEPLDADAVRIAFEELARRISRDGPRLEPEALADGFLRVAVESMARAVKTISVGRGHDVTRYALVCFGGAGGQLACRVADALGMSRILIHPFAGVLSAYGIGLADHRILRQASLERDLDAAGLAAAVERLDALEAEAAARLRADGAGEPRAGTRRLHVRYRGSDTALETAVPDDPAAGRALFEAAYRRRFAFTSPEAGLVIEAVSVEVVSPGAPPPAVRARTEGAARREAAAGEADFWSEGRRLRARIWRREGIAPGARVAGPALIVEETSTTAVEPGWTAVLDAEGALRLEREAPPPRPAASARPDPVNLEVFNSLFMSAAEQMGAALQNTAMSVNIKERLDFSCAVFDADGALIANAPHMPVHLGSMGESVRAALACGPRPGQVIALNNPYRGGTHLPDVTVVMPVFDAAGTRIRFTVAARGHHADIGGITPGSMPARSRTLAEEGVLLDRVLLVSDGRFREAEIRALLASGPHPARNPDQNVADLKAQAAACARGAEELNRLMEVYGEDVVAAYMGHVRDNAAACVRRMLRALPDGRFRCEFDSGAAVQVEISVDREAGRARIDFTGTSPQVADNFNAPASITRAAALYVLRTLIAEDIPLNDGCLEPVELVVPEGSMLRPRPPAAVVAGNVETSQIVTDALYGATGRLAGSQGTMNNLTFGDARRQYYETLCGGAGAGPGFHGASAVQTHMTNSRLTDPEVLEQRFPVRLERFAIRVGSGGAGRWRGGDGVVRAIRFLEPMSVSLLANRRRVAPFGLEGGAPGATGTGRVERVDGRVDVLAGAAETEVRAGDLLVIETPGGGGFGAPE